MNEILRVFLINLVSDIDNMLILGTILRRYAYLNITLPAVFVLTFTRSLYVAIIEGLSKLPMFHLLVGIILAVIAFKLVTRTIRDEKLTRITGSFLMKVRVLLLLAAADFLICMDSVVVIYEFSTRMTSVVIGIFVSLVISLHFLPLIEKLAANFFWINIIAGGFIVQNAVIVISKEPWIVDWIHSLPTWYPNTNLVSTVANGAVIVIVLTGLISYLKQQRMEL